MSPTEIATLLTALTALVGAAITWLTNRNRPTVDRTQALVAEQQAISEIRSADIDALRAIIASLREEVTALQRRVTDAEARARRAETLVRVAEQRAEYQSHYVRILLQHWGRSPTPPPPPPLPPGIEETKDGNPAANGKHNPR